MPDTIQETLTELAARGFEGDFRAHEGRLVCDRCAYEHDPADVVVLDVIRFEGITDPDDEAAVFAVSCRACGAKGAYVVAFGPYVAEEDVEVVRGLRDGR